MRFPAQKNTGCPKAPRDFPPRKDGILHFPSDCLGTPLPLPQSLYGPVYVRAYADVTTTISWIDTLPNLLSNGAPLQDAFQGYLRHTNTQCSRLRLYTIFYPLMLHYQEGVMNLGLGTSAGIGERKSKGSGHRDVTYKSVREIQRKVKLANVYSPVSQKEQIKTMKERKVCCIL